MMRVVVTGVRGQLGAELLRTRPHNVEVIGIDLEELDICEGAAVRSWMARTQPRLIINAAAYTAVDRAESEPDLADAVNAGGAANLAVAAREVESRLVQISTDFVFDGSLARPYRPEDPPMPLSVYGASKFSGEERTREEHPAGTLVLRTAWLYSSHGVNFVKTMLNLMSQRDRVEVVCDQIGTPTWARSLAEAIWSLADQDVWGRILHWTDSGVASWYDFAVAIAEEGKSLGLLERVPEIVPIRAEAFPAAARRPHFSVLDKSETSRILGCPAPHWRSSLRLMLAELVSGG
jgi:dTDP-4-dehydrorhamnose reductase